MKLTQKDFEARLARVDEGTADDEDRRLIKHYRREGYRAADDPVDGSWLAQSGGVVEGAEDGTAPEVDDPDDWASLGYRDLQKAARERGLNAGGSEADLVDRLREHSKQRRDAADAGQE